MKLSEDQINAVKEWVRAGAKPAEVQKKLQEECDVSMTYMDVRFLVDDLELEWKDSEPTTRDASDDLNTPSDPEKTPEEDFSADDTEAEEVVPVGQVQVEVSKLTRPGTMVSGNVVFSDGTKAEWGLDQMGRIMMQPEKEGYKPPEDDIRAFQEQLSAQLEKQGF